MKFKKGQRFSVLNNRSISYVLLTRPCSVVKHIEQRKVTRTLVSRGESHVKKVVSSSYIIIIYSFIFAAHLYMTMIRCAFLNYNAREKSRAKQPDN